MTSPRRPSSFTPRPHPLDVGLRRWAEGDVRKQAAVEVLLGTSLRDAIVHRVGHFNVRPAGYDGPLTWLDWGDVVARHRDGRLSLWGEQVVLFGVVDWLLGTSKSLECVPVALGGLSVEDRAVVERVLAGLDEQEMAG